MTTTRKIAGGGVRHELGRASAERAAEHNEHDSFGGENYARLKERGALAAGIPAALGGGDASHAELCAMVRTLARHCSSTGLAFSMHTHLIGALAYSWRGGNKMPEPLLRRGGAGGPGVISTGGAPRLGGARQLGKGEGGLPMTGGQNFSSGGPPRRLLMSTAGYDD